MSDMKVFDVTLNVLCNSYDFVELSIKYSQRSPLSKYPLYTNMMPIYDVIFWNLKCGHSKSFRMICLLFVFNVQLSLDCIKERDIQISYLS